MIFINNILVFIIRLAKDLVSGVVIAAFVVWAVGSPRIVLSCGEFSFTNRIVSKNISIIVVS